MRVARRCRFAMTAAKHVELIKRLSAAGVALEICDKYVALLKQFLSAGMSKTDFESALRRLLPKDKIRVHNQIVKWILSSALSRKSGSVQLPVLVPAKDKKPTATKKEIGTVVVTPAGRPAPVGGKKGTLGKRKAGAGDLVPPAPLGAISPALSATDRKSAKGKRAGALALAATAVKDNTTQKFLSQSLAASRKKNAAANEKTQAAMLLADPSAQGKGKDPGQKTKSGKPPAKRARVGQKSKGDADGVGGAGGVAGAQRAAASAAAAVAAANAQALHGAKGRQVPVPLQRPGVKLPARAPDLISYPNMVFVPGTPGAGLDLELLMRLRHRVQRIASMEFGIQTASDDSIALLTHALESHLKSLLEASVQKRRQRCGDAPSGMSNQLDALGSYKRVTPLDVFMCARENTDLLGNDHAVYMERLLLMMHHC
ncbi:hypothetical protein FVE85_9278 [Porphyridium purpureum]|uniref:Uncharacterized protein n=1 Tax=Porphyridium purpureum TaxID=35688 RepID=A0A5J4YNW8_PORPP|nr:hypothetical protein FVE85_9278 [Porphyridium purpureum]|eukprot:POR4057..scf222_8